MELAWGESRNCTPGGKWSFRGIVKRWVFWAGLVFLGLVVGKYDREFGFTELAGFGEKWEHRITERLRGIPHYVKARSGGYDGQFYAQLALDPSLQTVDFEVAIDAPSYRARRIFLPALAFAAGYGQTALVLQIYCLLNVVCWGLCGWILWVWLSPVSPVGIGKWLVCMFGMGVMESVRLSLTDLPALTLLLAALRAVHNDRLGSSLLANGAALFTKETALLNWVMYLTGRQTARQNFWRWAGGSLAIGAAYGGWILYTASRFPLSANLEGNLDWPLVGMIREGYAAVRCLMAGQFDSRYYWRIVAALGLLFQFCYLVRRREYDNPLWRVGVAYGVLWLLLGSYVWSGYWAVCRAALPLTAAYIILLKTDRPRLFWLALVLPNLSLFHGLARWF